MDNKKYLGIIVIALVLIFAGSYFANYFHTSAGKVETERVYFDTERGTLSGILYLPDGVSEKSPRPCVVATHGYLNTGEMQDLNAIELSRRGYVVLALDMYDHGHSKAENGYTGSFMHFWPTAIWDAAQYMYEKPYVLKDAEGNGMIGVMGHSMGGFSSSMAVHHDEQSYAEKGYRVIKACLSVGSDYHWTSYLGLDTEAAVKGSGGRIQGKICAQFDEFFFNTEDAGSNTVVKKNYVATNNGKIFLEQENPKPETWYDTKDGGKRIVYQPYEIHPWNHFSKTSASYAVDFYKTAFEGYDKGIEHIDSKNQTWIYKELCEFVALIGFFLLMMPLVMLFIQLPFFKKAISGEVTPVAVGEISTGKSMSNLFITIFTILLPAMLFPTLMDKNFGSYTMIGLTAVGAITIIVGLYGLLRSNNKRVRIASGIIMLTGVALVLLTRFPSFVMGHTFSAPTTNQIAYWALICASFTIIFAGMAFVKENEEKGFSFASYGLKHSLCGVFASFVTALIPIAIGYALLFLVDKIWLVDFRIWTFAIKTFESHILAKTLPYIAPFFVYYLVSGANIFVNTNTDKMKGIKGYLYAMLLNTGGIVLYLVLHYGLLVTTGTALFPTQSLSSILLMALVPTLCIAAAYTRYLYKRMGNVWTAAFLNAILMTLMTVANTCVYYR